MTDSVEEMNTSAPDTNAFQPTAQHQEGNQPKQKGEDVGSPPSLTKAESEATQPQSSADVSNRAMYPYLYCMARCQSVIMCLY